MTIGMTRRALGALTLSAGVLAGGRSARAGTEAAYAWRNVAVGAGGFIPGIVFSPVERGLAYARSEALLQTWGTAARRHPVGGLGSIGEMLIEHNHGFGQGRGSNSECSFNQAHLPHDTWLQAPCLGLSFA